MISYAGDGKKGRHMMKLSTGQDATLGNYLALTKVAFGPESKPAKYLEAKIAESPNGVDEEVIQDESQMVYMLGSMALEARRNAVADAA